MPSGQRRRTEVQEVELADTIAVEQPVIVGDFARIKHCRLGTAQRNATHAGKLAALVLGHHRFGAFEGGERHGLDGGAFESDGIAPLRDQAIQQAAQVAVLVRRDVVGLGRGEQHPVDPAAEQPVNQLERP